jgi:hypothetical protein
LTDEKVGRKVGCFSKLKKLPEVSSRPMAKKFAQSGHPDHEPALSMKQLFLNAKQGDEKPFKYSSDDLRECVPIRGQCYDLKSIFVETIR